MQSQAGSDLPPDLTARGWRLIARAPDRLFAISADCGGTVVSAAIEDVVKNARAMTRYIAWRKEQEASKVNAVH
jgi:hypothetical protein